MGVDFADYNNDGRPDIFLNALSLEGYALYKNEGALLDDVSDQAGISRISKPYSGWGVKFVDLDNDGWKDLFVAQGHVMDTISIDFPQIPYRQPLLVLRNLEGSFLNVSAQSGPAFTVPRASRGAAFGDFNNDGFVDVVVNNNDEAPTLLKNNGNENTWILIDLEGSETNRDGIGARIHIVSESGAEQFGVVTTASSYLSASDKRVHFGLGQDRVVKELQVQWPRGAIQRLKDVKANQTLKVKEPVKE